MKGKMSSKIARTRVLWLQVPVVKLQTANRRWVDQILLQRTIDGLHVTAEMAMQGKRGTFWILVSWDTSIALQESELLEEVAQWRTLALLAACKLRLRRDELGR